MAQPRPTRPRPGTRAAGRTTPRTALRPGRLALIAALVLGAAALWYRAPIAGYTRIGAAYGARIACACRHIGGRPLDDCEKDFEPGMAAVFVREDADRRSVTAYVPLLASETATYRKGWGCLPERRAG